MQDEMTVEYLGVSVIITISFKTDLNVLSATRVGAGFQILLPITVKLRTNLLAGPRLMISNLVGAIHAKHPVTGARTTVGRCSMDGWLSAGIHKADASSDLKSQSAYLSWRGSLADLAIVEEVRQGQALSLAVELEGDYCFLLVRPELPIDDTRVNLHSEPRVRTDPHRFRPAQSTLDVKYAREVWQQTLRHLGVGEFVLVEIPVPGKSVDPRWDDVWKALSRARQAFEQGGSSGWQSCAVQVRQALEHWYKIEGADLGPADPKAKTDTHRLNQLRQALYACTNGWIHPGDEATRDDAVLLLATLSALLAERKP